MPSETHALFPCWGSHQRMGHNTVVAHFEAGPGTSVIARIPALPADPDAFRLGTEERVLVLPMDGPAFYGFEVLPEATAMASLLLSRPVDFVAREERRQIAMSADAVEVTPAYTRDADDDDDLPY